MQVLNWLYGVRYPRSSPPMQPVVFPRGEIKVRKPTCAEVEALDDHHFHGYRRGKLVRVTLCWSHRLLQIGITQNGPSHGSYCVGNIKAVLCDLFLDCV